MKPADYNIGDKCEDINEIQRFLALAGFLTTDEKSAIHNDEAGLEVNIASTGVFDEATQNALREYQTFYGIEPTGSVNTDTVALMAATFCGSTQTPRRSWRRTNLTYRLENVATGLTEEQVNSALVEAFQMWSAVVPITINRTSVGGDIIVKFVTGAHGDSFTFDGPGGVLAHAFYPENGDIHFDDSENWTVAVTQSNVRRVAAHEIGHSLGLGHSSVANSMMRATTPLPAQLGWNDREQIRLLYGARCTDPRPVSGWFGAENQGGDVAVFDINGTGRPDVIVAHIDNPSGENRGYYRIGWDLDRDGIVQNGWTRPIAVPGWFGAQNQAAGVAVTDINGNGRPDIVVFHMDNPSGENRGYYRIGWNLNASGTVTGGWTNPVAIPGWFGAENQGGSIAIDDINRNGRPDLVVFHLDNPSGENRGYYRIGWDLNNVGAVTGGWTNPIQVPGWFGAQNQGGGIAIGNVSGIGARDLIVFHIDNPSGENSGYYRVGRNLNPAGQIQNGWGAPVRIAGWFGAQNQGGGMAVTDLDGDGNVDMVVFHLDNPSGENRGYYRMVRNI